MFDYEIVKVNHSSKITSGVKTRWMIMVPTVTSGHGVERLVPVLSGLLLAAFGRVGAPFDGCGMSGCIVLFHGHFPIWRLGTIHLSIRMARNAPME